MFFGILFIFGGLVNVLAPQFIYLVTQSWKSSSGSSPSQLFIVNTRFGGVVLILIGIAALIFGY